MLIVEVKMADNGHQTATLGPPLSHREHDVATLKRSGSRFQRFQCYCLKNTGTMFQRRTTTGSSVCGLAAWVGGATDSASRRLGRRVGCVVSVRPICCRGLVDCCQGTISQLLVSLERGTGWPYVQTSVCIVGQHGLLCVSFFMPRLHVVLRLGVLASTFSVSVSS